MKVNDKFKAKYPFILISTKDIFSEPDEFWVMGCRIGQEEDGNGYTFSNTFECDGSGFIEFEILAIVEMPRKYKDRILYKINSIDPDGEEKKRTKAHTTTIDRFKEMIVRPYRAEWEC